MSSEPMDERGEVEMKRERQEWYIYGHLGHSGHVEIFFDRPSTGMEKHVPAINKESPPWLPDDGDGEFARTKEMKTRFRNHSLFIGHHILSNEVLSFLPREVNCIPWSRGRLLCLVVSAIKRTPVGLAQQVEGTQTQR